MLYASDLIAEDWSAVEVHGRKKCAVPSERAAHEVALLSDV
jgi:hypothetical protein